jgi:hypothetical protein
VFFLWLASPKVVELTDDRCVIRIPLNWRTRRRDIRAMYLGTLCMGADVAAGLIACKLVHERKARVSFIFKDIKGELLKRAEGDVLFTNEDGPIVQDLVRRTTDRRASGSDRTGGGYCAVEAAKRAGGAVRVDAVAQEAVSAEASVITAARAVGWSVANPPAALHRCCD